MPADPAIETLLSRLRRIPNRYAGEAALSRQVELALIGLHLEYEPEHRFNKRDRIDYLVTAPRVGIEVKVAGAPLAIMRQLYRYADSISEIILVTSRGIGHDFPPGLIRNSKNEPVTVHHVDVWQNMA